MKTKIVLLIFLTLWVVYAFFKFGDVTPKSDVVTWLLSALSSLLVIFGWIELSYKKNN
jgi:nicotinamide riboside transporter PnuC